MVYLITIAGDKITENFIFRKAYGNSKLWTAFELKNAAKNTGTIQLKKNRTFKNPLESLFLDKVKNQHKIKRTQKLAL